MAGLGDSYKVINKTGKIAHGLESFFYLKGEKLEKIRKHYGDFFLDSGAFSAWSKKKPVDIDKYISFIFKYEDYFTHYAALDAIGDPEKSIQNLRYMESKGLNPIPCYHYGEPWSFLEDLLKEYEYIALGGMVPISTVDLKPWLDECFHRICDSEGNPKVKVHGFGLTTVSLLFMYPWYSCDSTSPIIAGSMTGKLILPESGSTIDLSRNGGITSLDQRNYIESRGWDLKDIKDNWFTRVAFNIQTFEMIEKMLTENPPKFLFKQMALI